jgi:hypothetical protein
MHNEDESQAIRNILCPMCIEVYEGQLDKAELSGKKDESRQARDIYRMEQEAQEMEILIQQSLPPEKREAYWILIANVQAMAENCARQAVRDWAEQGILYNILMAGAWKAAQSYDPSRSRFSTWVFRHWRYAIKEFRRVKRLPTESLFSTGNDSRNQSPYQDQLQDLDSASPYNRLLSKELTDWADSTLEAQPLMKFMIDDACLQYEWLCPFCRRTLRDYSSRRIVIFTEKETEAQQMLPDVYARRSFWKN